MIFELFERLIRFINPIRFWRKRGVSIGNNCVIFSSANLGGEPFLVSIGDNVRITTNVTFVTHDGGVWVLRHQNKDLSNIDLFGKITVGNNVHIGNNVTIMPNVHIGSNCIIGVGAIVTHDIPDNSIAAGIPARVIESIDDYYMKNKDRFVHTKGLRKKEKEKWLKENL